MNFMIFPAKLRLICVSLWGIWMGITFSVFAQDNAHPDSAKLSVKSIIPDSFPEVVLILNGDRQIQTDTAFIQVYENDKKVNDIQFESNRLNHKLKVAILFDCSEKMESESEEDYSASMSYGKEGIKAFMGSLKFPGDSIIMVNYAATISNTDLNDNLTVMEMILGSLEPEKEGRVFYDALQLGIEALNPYSGRKIIVAMARGEDQGSETPLETITQSADILDIPLYIIGVGEIDKNHFEKVARKTGGDFFYAESPEELEDIYLNLSSYLQEVYELTYTSPNANIKSGDRRSVKIVFDQGEEKFSLNTSFRIPIIENPRTVDDIPVVPETGKSYLGMILALIFLILAGVGLVWWKRRSDAIGLIVPAITEVALNPKKPELKAWVNIPQRDRPARFTIFSASGVPKKDFVFSGSKRRVKVDISSLEDGVYFCVLSNGGLDSERKEIVIDR